MTFQSIAGGQSFAEILFGKIRQHSSGSKDLLLRGCSLHKVGEILLEDLVSVSLCFLAPVLFFSLISH